MNEGEVVVKEEEWLVCADPWKMLEFLWDRSSPRKQRLFACACVRRVWRLLVDRQSQVALELAEAFADQQASAEELDEIAFEAASVARYLDPSEEELAVAPRDALYWAARAAALVAATSDSVEPDWIREASGCAVYAVKAESESSAEMTEWSAQAHILRDLFGPLPLGQVGLAPTVVTAELVHLVQVVYEERCLPSGTLSESRLAVFSDALEEAGCIDSRILSHCREAGPHVQGCWVVDALLGRM
jgi:hypothetical protein